MTKDGSHARKYKEHHYELMDKLDETDSYLVIGMTSNNVYKSGYLKIVQDSFKKAEKKYAKIGSPNCFGKYIKELENRIGILYDRVDEFQNGNSTNSKNQLLGENEK